MQTLLLDKIMQCQRQQQQENKNLKVSKSSSWNVSAGGGSPFLDVPRDDA